MDLTLRKPTTEATDMVLHGTLLALEEKMLVDGATQVRKAIDAARESSREGNTHYGQR